MYISLKNKIFILFVGMMIVSVSIIGYYGYKSASDSYINSAYDENLNRVKSLAVELENKLSATPSDILYQTNLYALKQFLIWKDLGEHYKSDMWKKVCIDALQDFMFTKKIYYKGRIIGNDGKEIINIFFDRKSDKIHISPENKLQDRSYKNYFKDAITLNKDAFLVSDFNLNREFGQIEKPIVPAVRFSTPIVDSDGYKRGVFVATIYGDIFLDTITQNMQKSEHNLDYFLVDEEGEFLYHKDEERRWAKDSDRSDSIFQERGSLKEQIDTNENGVYIEGDNIISYYRVYPDENSKKQYWTLVSVSSKNVALEALSNFKTLFFLLLIGLFFSIFFIIKYAIEYFTSPIMKVDEVLQKLAIGEISEAEIVYSSTDEISGLVTSTQQLISATKATISQANAVAMGDFSREYTLHSDQDELGLAIANMTKRLRDISNFSQKLSVGDYKISIASQSSQDDLANSLSNMITYLNEITDIVQKIASGNLNIEYQIKSERDELGKAISEMIVYLRHISNQAEAITYSDFSLAKKPDSSSDELGFNIYKMSETLRQNRAQSSDEIWLSEGSTHFNKQLSELESEEELLKTSIRTMCQYIEGASGVLYLYDKVEKKLLLKASYAFIDRDNDYNSFDLGEGIVGQVGLERSAILLRNVHPSAPHIQSGLQHIPAMQIYTFALEYENRLLGVCEILSSSDFSELHKNYLENISKNLAVMINATHQNVQIKTLLGKSQKAYEELQIQSEELQETNVQMEEQQQQLTLQSQELKHKNETLLSAKEEIKKRADEIERASQYKNEFLANMSHELRTPLNSIILLSKLLSQNADGVLTSDTVDQVSVIHHAGNDLLALINDILDLSKIESGKMELELHLVNSSEICDELQGLFGILAKEKGLDFVIEDHFNSSVEIDKTKLLQVLKNLLSNALKFTKEGEVRLIIHQTEDSVLFSVHDSGIGIAQEKIATIFEAFKQVDGSISREFGGTGLGLSISKTMVELMHGSISVESQLGSGSTFTISLPLNYIAPTVKEITQKEKEQETIVPDSIELIREETNENVFSPNMLAEKNILIVDDDSRNIFAMTSILELMDAEVYSAFNGEEAIALLESNNNIDLILMDIMMPIMDGLDAIKHIKENPSTKEIPIIAVTAKSMKEDKEQCLRAGANDYLSKPIDHDQLLHLLKAHLGK
jgi:signal transduction histidine kinase/CheY-like chemotaxis protein